MIEECFGSNPRTKLIDIFLCHPYQEYDLFEDIGEFWIEFGGTNLTELNKFLKQLYDWGIIRKGSKKWSYTVRKKSDSYQLLNAFQNCLAGITIEKNMKNTKMIKID
jgi:hypothetical protein